MGLYWVAGFDLAALSESFSLTFSRSGETPFTIGVAEIAAEDDTVLSTSKCLVSHAIQFSLVADQYGNTPFVATWSQHPLHSLLLLAIQTAADAAGWTSTWSVSQTASTWAYNIWDTTSTDFAVAFANNTTRRILGFADDTDLSSEYTYTGTNTPTYSLLSTASCLSDVTDEYEPGNVAGLAVSDGGDAYGVARTQSPIYMDFTLQFESQAKSFVRCAATSHPWTFQHLFQHCRTVYPFGVNYLDLNGTDIPVLTMRPDGSSWAPRRAAPDWNAYWHIDFKCLLNGWYQNPI